MYVVSQSDAGEGRGVAINEPRHVASRQHLGLWWWKQTRRLSHQQGLY